MASNSFSFYFQVVENGLDGTGEIPIHVHGLMLVGGRASNAHQLHSNCISCMTATAVALENEENKKDFIL